MRASRKQQTPKLTPSERRKTRSLAPRLVDWFRFNARDLPWRRTTDPYAIWMSEIMLQQTQVATVVPYYERWMRALPNVQALAHCSSQRLHKLWEGLGYYTRVRNMQKAARLICQEHDGQFPDSFEQILALPGIGRYTAGAICSIAFNQPTPIVDGNVVRVLTRLFGIEDDPRKNQVNAWLWQLAKALVAAAADLPPNSALHTPHLSALPCSALNQSLMELGARICTPRNAQCSKCPVIRNCVAYRKGLVERLPSTASRPQVVAKLVRAFVVRDRNRVLAAQRPEGKVNAGLWEFPNTEVANAADSLQRSARAASGLRVKRLQQATTLKHSITRYRITLEVYTCELAEGAHWKQDPTRRWLNAADLHRLPFSAAHRQIARRLLSEQPAQTPPRRRRAT